MSLSIILIALVSLTNAVALPATEKTYHDIIPGPGLPTLAELNLTSADLYTMKPDLSPRAMSFHTRQAGGQAQAGCGPEDSSYTDVGDIAACYNYLNALGTQSCSISGQGTLCTSSSGEITGESISGGDASSYYSDVALAVSWVLNDCTTPDGSSVAGFQFANGNGDYAIGAYSQSYAG